MTDSVCGAKKRDGSGDVCTQPAGWGTEHVGEGRCKLHGGNAGAPANNQNASKHGLNADPHHYFESLPPDQKEWIEEIAASIEDRVRENTGEVDHMDVILSRQIAISLHISSKASAYIEKESGLVQEVPTRGTTRKEAAPLLEEVRRYDDAIFRDLKKLGILDDPESAKADALESWRSFIEDGRDS